MSGEPLRQRWRTELVDRWARRLNDTAGRNSSEDLRTRLADMLDKIVDPPESSTSVDETGQAIGAELVALRERGSDALSGSFEVLGDLVLKAVGDEQGRRALSMLAAIASGYAAAEREDAIEQRETVDRALLRSKLEADRLRDVSESHFREVFSGAPIPVAISNRSGELVEVNSAMVELLRYRVDQLESMTILDLFHPDEISELAVVYAELAEDGGPSRIREQCRLIDVDGTAIESYLAVSALLDGDGDATYFVTMVEDISELHRLQETFQHQALHDVLTGLPNRQFFLTQLESKLAKLPKETMVTLYHLGLNGFELINDGLGYETGDGLIKSVARRLEGLLDGIDGMVARFGGTEFAIFISESSDTPQAAAFAAMINEELSEPVYLGQHGIATSASIGVVRTMVADAEPSDMIWAADVALRRAEAAGHRQWALFDPDRAPSERIQARLAAVIPGALELGEFNVTYRPILEINTGNLAALEVQLQWQPEGYPTLGNEECLRLAERSGVTLSLRDWMLRTTWERLAEWYAAGYRQQVAIGLSPNQAQDPDLVASVGNILRDSDLDPSYLWLSVPIAAITGSRDEARENVGYLREMGVRTSLHGFHASPEEFRYLRKLRVHAVRLDPSLVRIVHETDNADTPDFQAVTRLAPLLAAVDGWVVVGELTSEEQAERWRSIGCGGVGVGPLFGEPLAAADVPALLDRLPTSSD